MSGPAEYPEIGPKPELAWLPVEHCEVDPAYQRSLETRASQKLIDKIAAEFSWMKFQALLATPKAGSDRHWLIVDGQHRHAGATKRGDIRELPALVFASASQAEQAMAFVGANKDRIPVSAQALYHAQLLAKDPEAVTIARLCEAARIGIVRWNLAAKQLPADKTAAVPAFREMLRHDGEEIAGEAIRIVAEAWRNQPGVLHSPFFRAASYFLKEGGKSEALLAALKRHGHEQLLIAASGTGGRSRIHCMVEVLRGWTHQFQANAGDSAAMRTTMAAGNDPASRLAGGRAPAPPSGAQTSASGVTAGRDRHPQAAPLKVGPLPSAKPASAPSADREAIDRFLAEKGATLVMGPEQIAAFLRDSGHRAVIREINENTSGKGVPKFAYRPELDGKPVSLDELYAAANTLRGKAGLKPVSFPAKAAAA